MTRRRGLLVVTLLVWAALVAGGLWVHGRLHSDGGRGAREVRAARALPANHRIEDTDLTVDVSARVRRSLPAVRDLLGRYLAGAKRQGEMIRRRDVTELPTLPSGDAGSATVVYQLPAPHRVLAELLDVGARVRLCAPATSPANPPCHPDPLEVLAVHPAGPESADAWLLLGLPSTAQAAVHRYLTADGHYLVVGQ